MRLATLAAFLGALALAVLAQSPEPYDFGVDVERLTRRADGPVIVGRLPLTLDGGVPHRLEIRQMRANQPQWDLFILALSMFQSVSQDDPLSWYQVAGAYSPCSRSSVPRTNFGEQAFTVSRFELGTASSRPRAPTCPATACTALSCFRSGIGRTWPWLRLVYLVFSSRSRMLIRAPSKNCFGWPRLLRPCSPTRSSEYSTKKPHQQSDCHTGTGLLHLRRGRLTSPTCSGTRRSSNTAREGSRLSGIPCTRTSSILSRKTR